MNPTDTPAAEATASSALHLWDLILQGGWAMIPLFVCSTAALLLLGLGWLDTRPRRFLPPDWRGLQEPLHRRDLAAAGALLNAAPSVLGLTLAAALERARPALPDGDRSAVEQVLGERLDAEEARYARRVLYLNVIASVAPMIGLLGTVSGMIGAFQSIGRGGMGRPEVLAGDIGQALVTTAAGLIVGIPAMVGYFALRHRLAARIAEVAAAAETLLNALAASPEPTPTRRRRTSA